MKSKLSIWKAAVVAIIIAVGVIWSSYGTFTMKDASTASKIEATMEAADAVFDVVDAIDEVMD